MHGKIETLSTGSLLLIITFVDKLFVEPEWAFLIGVSIVSFLVSVVAAVGAMTAAVENAHKAEMWVGFLLGILSLAVFALKNLY